MGGTAVTGFVARSVAQTLFQFVPVAGAAVSVSVAFTTTWALGRSAERYFFDDETVSPNSLSDQAEELFEKENRIRQTFTIHLPDVIRRKMIL